MKNESARLELREVRGPLNDLMTKLESEKGQEWNEALRRFLRKEDPWVTPAVPAPKKSSIRVIGNFTLKPYKGKSDLKQLVKAGNYDWTNSEITPDCFTAKVIGSLDEEVECVLVQSDKDPGSEEILPWTKQNNCERPTANAQLPETPCVSGSNIPRSSGSIRSSSCLSQFGTCTAAVPPSSWTSTASGASSTSVGSATAGTRTTSLSSSASGRRPRPLGNSESKERGPFDPWNFSLFFPPVLSNPVALAIR